MTTFWFIARRVFRVRSLWHSTACRNSEHVPATLLRVVLVAIVGCGTTVSGLAQVELPPPVPPEAEIAPLESTDGADVSAETQPSLSTATVPAEIVSNLWVVSTHASPQSFRKACPQLCPGVSRYVPCCGYQQSSFQELVSSLPPGAPICIYVHGSFVGMDEVCEEAICTYNWLTRDCPGSPLQLICLTWPSDKPLTPLLGIDVCVLGKRAERNGYYLADLVQFLPAASPICLMGHSHGTRVVASALHLMGGGEIEGHRHRCASCAGRQIRVVFAAAAIDHNWFNPGKRYECGLRCTQCVLNITNRHDPALKIYPLHRPFASRALGSSGFTRSDVRKLDRNCWKLKELDVTDEFGHVHFWPEYFNRPWVAARLRNFVHATDVNAYASR